MQPEQQRAMEFLAKKGTLAPVDQLREQLRDACASIEQSFDDVPAHLRGVAPAAGKWSPAAILDHLVLSHEPAIAQFASLLSGVSPPAVAIPAGLQSAERPPWDELRTRLAGVHRELQRLLDGAPDDASLEPKAIVEMVVKAGGAPLHWHEPLDWKAFIQAIRMHTLGHREQLLRTIDTVR